MNGTQEPVQTNRRRRDDCPSGCRLFPYGRRPIRCSPRCFLKRHYPGHGETAPLPHPISRRPAPLQRKTRPSQAPGPPPPLSDHPLPSPGLAFLHGGGSGRGGHHRTGTGGNVGAAGDHRPPHDQHQGRILQSGVRTGRKPCLRAVRQRRKKAIFRPAPCCRSRSTKIAINFPADRRIRPGNSRSLALNSSPPQQPHLPSDRAVFAIRSDFPAPELHKPLDTSKTGHLPRLLLSQQTRRIQKLNPLTKRRNSLVPPRFWSDDGIKEYCPRRGDRR